MRFKTGGGDDWQVNVWVSSQPVCTFVVLPEQSPRGPYGLHLTTDRKCYAEILRLLE